MSVRGSTPREDDVERRSPIPDPECDATLASRETEFGPKEQDQFDRVYRETVATCGGHPPTDPNATVRSTTILTDTETIGGTRRPVFDSDSVVLGDDFEVMGTIGVGGMGIVFKARQKSLDREVAVKVMRGELRSHPRLQEDFVSEALVTGVLDHPNIVPVVALSDGQDGLISFAMKLVGGRPWSALLHSGEETEALGLERHLEILKSVSNAVAFAHSKGILHRDLKPDNVMVGEFGEVLVMDWGLACRYGEDDSVPPEHQRRSRHAMSVSQIEGTPIYLAPEMALGHGSRFGPWTDVYLLGAILCEILTGQAPHHGTTFREVVMQAAHSAPPHFDDSSPRGLQEICSKAMAGEISQRFQSVTEFIEALWQYDQHRESEKLAAAATEAVAEARDATQSELAYARYQRAIAGYEQAVSVWPGNRAAIEELVDTHREIAVLALEEGDLGLARSHLDFFDDNEDLTSRIMEAEDEQASIQRAAHRQRQVLAACALIVMAALSVGFVLVTKEKDRVVQEKQRVTEEKERVTRLKDGRTLRLLLERAEELYPARPDRVEELRTWLDDAASLLSGLPIHRATLRALEDGAGPYSEEQRRADYPDAWPKLTSTRRQLEDVMKKLEGAPNEVELRRLEAAAEELEAKIEQLQERTAHRRSWGLTDEEAWRRELLSELVAKLMALDTPGGLVADVEARLETAREVGPKTLEDHAEAWRQVRARIRESGAYGELELKPQLGLIPLGPDSTTGLEEFLHWESHQRDTTVPKRVDGRFAVGTATGIILVLLPGGKFLMGAGPQTEQARMDEEPILEIALAPFFMGKYEVTQAQWKRYSGANPSQYFAGIALEGVTITPSHPVEQIDWRGADLFARRQDLQLPTEAQWEYACRAGTTTPFFSGAKLAQEFANIADEGSKSFYQVGWSFEPGVHDGYALHAPVGQFAPNAFGLHDTHGNVSEWVRDYYDSYAVAVEPETGVRRARLDTYRNSRGGDFNSTEIFCRSAARNRLSAHIRSYNLGFRVSAPIR